MRFLNAFLCVILLLTACSTPLPELHETVCIDGSVGKLQGQVDRPAVPDGKAPVAIILHGLTGYRTEPHLNALADSLQARGVATVRFDFNGHGESEGRFSSMTLFNELEDAHLIYDYVAALPWVDPKSISVAGHSQGGLEAGLLAGELGAGKVRKLLLLAPAACIHTMAEEGSLFGYETGDTLPDSLQFWGGRYLGKAYLQSALDCDVYGITARYEGPVRILQGMDDSPGLIRDAKRYLDYLPQAEFIPLEGLSHCYPEDLGTPARLGADFIAGD